MDWTALVGLPMTILLIVAVLGLLLSLFFWAALRQRLRERRPLAATAYGVSLLVALLLTVLCAGLSLTLRGYRRLSEETPIVEVQARILSPQRWALTLQWPDGSQQLAALSGDAFRIEAVVLTWKLPAVLAGLPPVYRLDRLSGRYDDPAQEEQLPRTVVGFNQAGSLDLLDLKRRYPASLPGVDALFGSGVYLPLVDEGHYRVSLDRMGHLLARPDDDTQQRIGQPLGD